MNSRIKNIKPTHRKRVANFGGNYAKNGLKEGLSIEIILKLTGLTEKTNF